MVYVLRKSKTIKVTSCFFFADGGYATKSWKQMITSGVALNKAQQRKSLEWIREESMSPQCIESLATHDSDITPHVIEL
ncbi:hypothetical protein NHP194004_02470 [Helicobacter suis]|nr:hypothetical protein NHP194004_02470 [Helicobacter suis]